MTTNPAPFTIRSLVGASAQPPRLDQSVLVVIDAQDEYGPDGLLALPVLEPALANVTRLVDAARTAGASIIHVAHIGAAGMPFDPVAGGRFLAGPAPATGEAIVEKTLPNAFAGTNLHELLQAASATQLILAGFMTHMCVSSTARAALDLGYATTVVGDAAATRDLPSPDGKGVVAAHDLHRAALAALADRFSLVTTTEAVLAVAGV